MEARITFRSEIYIEGEDIVDALEKFQNMPLFSADALDCSAEFIEVTSLEKVETVKSNKQNDNGRQDPEDVLRA